jgi:Zn-dependent protease with chaperone function
VKATWKVYRDVGAPAVDNQVAIASFAFEQVCSPRAHHCCLSPRIDVDIVPSGRMWINAKLLDNPKQLLTILAHELGHFSAAPDRSQDAARTSRKTFT